MSKIDLKINHKLGIKYDEKTQTQQYHMVVEFVQGDNIVKTIEKMFEIQAVHSNIEYNKEEQELKTLCEEMIKNKLVKHVSNLCLDDVKEAVKSLGIDPETGKELPESEDGRNMLKYYKDLSTPMNLKHQAVDITSDK
jgi:hypothetical protein